MYHHVVRFYSTFPRSQQASSEPKPLGEETAAEKAAGAKAAELERELSEANVKVEGLERELTKLEQSAKDAKDAKNG